MPARFPSHLSTGGLPSPVADTLLRRQALPPTPSPLSAREGKKIQERVAGFVAPTLLTSNSPLSEDALHILCWQSRPHPRPLSRRERGDRGLESRAGKASPALQKPLIPSPQSGEGAGGGEWRGEINSRPAFLRWERGVQVGAPGNAVEGAKRRRRSGAGPGVRGPGSAGMLTAERNGLGLWWQTP